MSDVDSMMSDLDDSRVEVKKEENPVPNYQSNNSGNYNNGGGDKFNAWEDFDDLPSKALDVKSLKRFTRNVTVISFGEVPESIKAKLDVIIPKLEEAGFTMRLSGDERDKLEGIIAPMYRSKEYHLPWKKFNTNVTGETSKPTKYAYQISKGIHKGMPKVSNPVRAMIARNTHMMLGKNCDDATKMLIIYTADGAESKKAIDYKTTGTASYFIDVSEIIGTPIFNLQKEDSVDRIVQFLSALQQ